MRAAASRASSTRLWGTRRPSTQTDGYGVRGTAAAGPGAAMPLWTTVTAAGSTPRPTSSPAGRLGDGDVAGAPVEAGGEPGLDPPADPRLERRQDHPPLLPVDVVDEDDQGPPAPQGGEERHAVLDVHHHLVAAETPAEVGPPGVQVHGEPPAAAHHPDVADPLAGRSARVGGAEQGDRPALGGQPGRDPLHEHLGAAALGMGGVAPVEDEDAGPAVPGPGGVGGSCAGSAVIGRGRYPTSEPGLNGFRRV